MAALKQRIASWSHELGFQRVGISDIELGTAEERLGEWLRRRHHGSMSYMERHGLRRSRPDELVPGTLRVISVRMDYLPEYQDSAKQLLDHESRAYISRYALGRDYHKVLRGRLRELARRIETQVGTFGYRVFVDSAPVLEKPIAEKAGLGWIVGQRVEGKKVRPIRHRLIGQRLALKRAVLPMLPASESLHIHHLLAVDMRGTSGFLDHP